MRHARARAREQRNALGIELDAVGMPDIGADPAQAFGVLRGVRPNFSREKATSLSFSARWVCSDTPCARASTADSRISSRVTENGEHGASTTRSMEWRALSWYCWIRRRLSRRMASSSSTTASGGRPPLLRPRLMEPRAA